VKPAGRLAVIHDETQEQEHPSNKGNLNAHHHHGAMTGFEREKKTTSKYQESSPPLRALDVVLTHSLRPPTEKVAIPRLPPISSDRSQKKQQRDLALQDTLDHLNEAASPFKQGQEDQEDSGRGRTDA